MRNRGCETVQKFWHDLRKGAKVKRRTNGKPRPHSVMDCGNVPSRLAAHRAQLEHDKLWKNVIPALREAAKEFDAWSKAELQLRQSKTRKGRKKLASVQVGRYRNQCHVA